MTRSTSLTPLVLLLTPLLISLTTSAYVKIHIQTSEYEGNYYSEVYLTLISKSGSEVSETKRLGQMPEGSMRWFSINAQVSPEKIDCLKFTLSGTDGWTMVTATMVTNTGDTYQFENTDNTKLDNFIPLTQNSVKFCDKTRGWFNLAMRQDDGTYKITSAVTNTESLLIFNNGTVCSHGFTTNAAQAICSELGYSGSATWSTHALTSYERRNYDIELSGLDKCSSYGVISWFECDLSTYTDDCSHKDDVFLTCGITEELSLGVIIAVIAGVAVILVIPILCYCYKLARRTRRHEQRMDHAATTVTGVHFSPDAQQRGTPSAPPDYEMVAMEKQESLRGAVAAEAPPSYDEAVTNPHHFRSSFRRMSNYLRRNREPGGGGENSQS